MKRNRAESGHRIGNWHGKAKHPDETVREAREMRLRGLTYTQIGNRLGVPWRTVADWVNYATRYDA